MINKHSWKLDQATFVFRICTTRILFNYRPSRYVRYTRKSPSRVEEIDLCLARWHVRRNRLHAYVFGEKHSLIIFVLKFRRK